MKIQFAIFGLTCILFSNSYAQVVKAHHLNPLLETEWVGSLEYKNYADGKMVKIPASLSVEKLRESLFELAFNYNDEPHANSKERVRLKASGKKINSRKVIVCKYDENGMLEIKTMSTGKDNRKTCTIFHTYQIGADNFTIKKDIQYDDSSDIFMRNRYSFEAKQ